VDLIVTSPPYFALRSYSDGGEHYDGQIGSEATPTAFLEALWAVTRECWRVLKPSGSLFVNLGDKYAGSGGHNNANLSRLHETDGRRIKDRDRIADDGHRAIGAARRQAPDRYNQASDGVRAKSLMGLPWRYAIGCIDGQADPDGTGWILRSEIVWSKPNGLPESVRDRVRRSHEQWFHLTKNGTYWADMDAIAQPRTWTASDGYQGHEPTDRGYGPKHSFRSQTARAEELAAKHGLTEDHRAALKARGLGDGKKSAVTKTGTGKNTAEVLRLAEEAEAVLGSYAREFTLNDPDRGKLPDSVWQIATQPLVTPDDLGDHFAAFPTEWPRRIISAWCPPDGVVLDPFGGTGTTAMVARALGRYGVSIDLSADYLRLANWRIWESGQAEQVARRQAERTTDPNAAEAAFTAAARLADPSQPDLFEEVPHA
jgi:DNA modification methylase